MRYARLAMVAAAVVLAVVSVCGTAWATGYTTSTTGDWTLAATWGGGGVPSSSADTGLINKGSWNTSVLATTDLGGPGDYPVITVGAGGYLAPRAVILVNEYTSSTTINNPITFDGGALATGDWWLHGGNLTGEVTITANGMVAAPGRNGNRNRITGKVTGDGGITVTCPDQNWNWNGLMLSNATNDFLGNVLITNGCLRLGVNHALPAGKIVQVNGSGSRVAYDVNQTYAAETPPTINLNGGTISPGTLDAGEGSDLAVPFTINVSAAGGYLNAGPGGSWGTRRHVTGTIDIAANGTCNVGTNRAGDVNWYMEGPITGNGKLRLYTYDTYSGGYGWVELVGTSNDYSGGTDVATKVRVRAETSLGTGPITLFSPASFVLDKTTNADWTLTNDLRGNGTVTVETGTGYKLTMNGGTVSPGASVGTLTVQGNFAMTNSAPLEEEIMDSSSRDVLNVNGTVDVAGGVLNIVALQDPLLFGTQVSILNNDNVTSLDPITGKFLNDVGGKVPFQWDNGLRLVDYVADITYEGDFATGALTGGNDIILYNFAVALSPVPEPAALSLIGLALLGLRKKRS